MNNGIGRHSEGLCSPITSRPLYESRYILARVENHVGYAIDDPDDSLCLRLEPINL